MRKIFWLCLLSAAFYAHGRLMFSEPRVMSWVSNHSARSLAGDATACDDYAGDATVNITATGARGRTEIEGGKEEICGYLKQASAALTVLRASTHTDFTDVEVSRGGFPWLQARVAYRETTTIQVSGLPPITVVSDDTLVVGRTFWGLRIKSVQARSQGGL